MAQPLVYFIKSRIFVVLLWRKHETSTFDEVGERLSHDHLYYLLFCSEFEYAIYFPNRRVQAIFALIKEAENHFAAKNH